jgi:hypothetical protein
MQIINVKIERVWRRWIPVRINFNMPFLNRNQGDFATDGDESKQADCVKMPKSAKGQRLFIQN